MNDARKHPHSASSAFTLVELLVVIGIIALLIGILLPTLNTARQRSVTVKCLSNLRQMTQAAYAYTGDNRGSFPPALWDSDNDGAAEAAWDFTTVTDATTGVKSLVPGFLWGRRAGSAGGTGVQQCPAYDKRRANETDPFTGYNYNTSFIGGRHIFGDPDNERPCAKLGQIREPSRTALFGDGGYSNGANKFMRAPLPSVEDRNVDTLPAGAQAFRHAGMTNVAFADGHAETVAIRLDLRTPTSGAWASKPVWRTIVGTGNGFLSQDNSAYDLR